jgi:acyl-CoA synthetase (AMP-forming)/AMP-acid ligase II
LIIDPEICDSALTPEVEAEITSPTFLTPITSTDSPSSQPERLTIIPFTFTIQSSLPYQPPYLAPPSSRANTLARHPAILISTSGTTGLPKPAITSWVKILIGGGYAGRWMGLRPATHSKPDRFYSCMPLYHSSAAVLGFSTCLMNGTTFILGRKFSVSGFWREVRESQATVLQYVGETCRYLLAAPVEPDPEDPSRNLDQKHKVRIAFGNGLRPDVWERFQTRFGVETIAEFYAATEGTSGSWNLSRNEFSRGAVGRNGVIAGLVAERQLCVVQVDYENEVPVRDPARGGLCIRVPRGEAGELLYKVDAADIGSKYQGYFNDAAASEKKILRDVLDHGDAWFRTGDVLRWDGEGRWWFVDRLGDTFRWRSENVSTAEVAQVLGIHPNVVEANVYGVQIPGHEGQAGCAAILLNTSSGCGGGSSSRTTKKEEPDPESDPEPDPDLMQELAAFLSENLPKYSVPVFLRVVRQMQRTGNMKQQKHVLRGEGVDLDKVEGLYGDQIWWLQGERYVRFRSGDWEALRGGRVRL